MEKAPKKYPSLKEVAPVTLINQHHILIQWEFVQKVAFVEIMDPEVEV